MNEYRGSSLAESIRAAWVEQGPAKAALLFVIAGFVYYAFWVQTFLGDISTYQWLRSHWRNVSHYSHGPLIPAIALWLVWWKRRELFAQSLASSATGYFLLAGGMLMHYVGIKANQPHASVMGFVGVLYGLSYALGGRGVFWVLFFPITFLFLMIPLNFLEERVAVPLRHLQAYLSVGALNGLGIEAVKAGTGIRSAVFNFDVANPCSGIQSLMALTTVTAAYGYVTLGSQWKRWVLFLSAMPLAVLGNFVRVLGITLLAQNFGTPFAMKVHDTVAGFIVFTVALSAMVGVGWLLSLDYRRLWTTWTQPTRRAATTS